MLMTPTERSAAPGQSSDRHSLWSVLRPLTGMMAATLVICLALLAALVMQMDQQGARQVQLMMKGAVDTRLSALAAMTRDYGRWDDAVLNLYGQLDRDWATANLSNATHVLVIDEQGRTLFSVGPDGSAGVDAAKAMPEGLADLLDSLPTSVEGARTLEDAIGIMTRFDGKPTLVAAMPVMPYSDRIKAPQEPLRYVLLTQALDQALLNEWQASFRLRRVLLAPSISSRDAASSASLQDSRGRSLGHIVWHQVKPGHDAARSILPYLLVGLALLGMAGVLLSRRVVGIVQALSLQNLAASRSAEVAAANLEMARQAQVCAEAAQMRAEAMVLHAEGARREAELQEFHRARPSPPSHAMKPG